MTSHGAGERHDAQHPVRRGAHRRARDGDEIYIGHYWISAVEGLTDAAERLGSGDLAASIPVGGGKELTLLGTTMSEMRRNLVELTADLRRSELEAKAVLGGIVEGVYPSTKTGGSGS